MNSDFERILKNEMKELVVLDMALSSYGVKKSSPVYNIFILEK